MRTFANIFITEQWRIQDFPEEGAPNAKVGARPHYFGKFSPKTAWKWEKNGPEGTIPGTPLGSDNAERKRYSDAKRKRKNYAMLCQLKYLSEMSTWKPDRLSWKEHWLWWKWLIVLTTSLSLLLQLDISLWRRAFLLSSKTIQSRQKCEALCNCRLSHAK